MIAFLLTLLIQPQLSRQGFLDHYYDVTLPNTATI